MVDLLSVDDLAAFMAAMDDLKDTFHKDDCVYLQYAEPFNRLGNAEPSGPTEHTLDCRVTKAEDSKSDTTLTVEGAMDQESIEIRFFSRYLDSKSLMSSGMPVFDTTKDYFKWNGDLYKLKRISTDDSDIDGTSVLIVCHCKKEPVSE